MYIAREQPYRDSNQHSTQTTCARGQLPDHSATLPMSNSLCRINIFGPFFSDMHFVWSLWSRVYHEFKDTFALDVVLPGNPEMHLDVTLDDVNRGLPRDIHIKILPTRVSASSCDIRYTSAARATNCKLFARALRTSPRENYYYHYWYYYYLPEILTLSN